MRDLCFFDKKLQLVEKVPFFSEKRPYPQPPSPEGGGLNLVRRCAPPELWAKWRRWRAGAASGEISPCGGGVTR